jgi:DNA-binding response OmpR family regulator
MSDTLLLADDSVTMQRVVELTFAEQGLKVVSVSDGQQAIDYITRQRPALTLVSVTLPKVNGFDVARFVRDHVESRVPVLLLAGAFDNLDEAQVRASGASGVLVKPFEPAVVIKRVRPSRPAAC